MKDRKMEEEKEGRETAKRENVKGKEIGRATRKG